MNKLTKYLSIPLGIVVIVLFALLMYGICESVKDIEWNNEKTSQQIIDLYTIRSKTSPTPVGRIRDAASGEFNQITRSTTESPISYSQVSGRVPSSVSVTSGREEWIYADGLNPEEKICIGKVTCTSEELKIDTFGFGVSIYTLTTQLETGEFNHYFKVYLVGDKDKGPEDLRGKKIPVQLSHAKTYINEDFVKETQKKDRMIWWAPKFGLGVGAELGVVPLEINPQVNLTFSPMGFGKSKNDLKLRILEIGPTYSPGQIGVMFSPGSIRFSNLLSNTYIRPISVGISTSNYFISTGIGVSF